jgi:hypothetical protein
LAAAGSVAGLTSLALDGGRWRNGGRAALLGLTSLTMVVGRVAVTAARAKIALVSFSRRVREVSPRIEGKHRAGPGAPVTSAIFTPYSGANPGNPSGARREIRILPPYRRAPHQNACLLCQPAVTPMSNEQRQRPVPAMLPAAVPPSLLLHLLMVLEPSPSRPSPTPAPAPNPRAFSGRTCVLCVPA